MHLRDSFTTYLSFINHMYSYLLSLPVSFSNRIWACSFDAFMWASTIVTTRSITEHHYIIPLMDFRNFISTDSVMFLFLIFIHSHSVKLIIQFQKRT